MDSRLVEREEKHQGPEHRTSETLKQWEMEADKKQESGQRSDCIWRSWYKNVHFFFLEIKNKIKKQTNKKIQANSDIGCEHFVRLWSVDMNH